MEMTGEKKIQIAVVAGVVLVALVAVVLVVVRGRVTAPAEVRPPVGTIPAGNSNGAVPPVEGGVTAPPTSSVSGGFGVDPALDRELTVEEKASYGYDEAAVVRIRATTQDDGSVGTTLVVESEPADGDFDGLPDQDESKYGADPTKPDTDSDGVDDGEEVRQHRTDPSRADTDGDGISDGEEIETKSDPLKK